MATPAAPLGHDVIRMLKLERMKTRRQRARVMKARLAVTGLGLFLAHEARDSEKNLHPHNPTRDVYFSAYAAPEPPSSHILDVIWSWPPPPPPPPRPLRSAMQPAVYASIVQQWHDTAHEANWAAQRAMLSRR